MRVISGIAKGRKLIAPKSNKVRPALDKVREAIFDILFDVRGRRVLDLFAGSGSVGIEALSRGASIAVFVDDLPAATAAIQRNLELLGFTNRARVIKLPAAKAITRLAKRGENFDLIFVDPPYLKNLVNTTLSKLADSSLLGAGATIVVEHHPKEQLEKVEGLDLTDTRKYGQTLVSFLDLVKRRS